MFFLLTLIALTSVPKDVELGTQRIPLKGNIEKHFH